MFSGKLKKGGEILFGRQNAPRTCSTLIESIYIYIYIQLHLISLNNIKLKILKGQLHSAFIYTAPQLFLKIGIVVFPIRRLS